MSNTNQNEVDAVGLMLQAFDLVKDDPFALMRLDNYATSLAKTLMAFDFLENAHKTVAEVDTTIRSIRSNLQEIER